MKEIKVYYYDSDMDIADYPNSANDYSKYVLIGSESEENLDDTLDTFSLTLAGLPTRDEFAPSSKFILQLVDNDTVVETWERIVDNDTVEQPIISNDGYFDHHISFIELGADAQQRVVDNISVTYKLKDVNLEEIPSYSTSEKIQVKKNEVNNTADVNFGQTKKDLYGYSGTESIGHNFMWSMPDYYQVNLGGDSNVTPSWEQWDNLVVNQQLNKNDDGTYEEKYVYLPIPMLVCKYGHIDTKSYSTNGYCSVEAIVEAKDINTSDDSYQAVDGFPKTINPSTMISMGSNMESFWNNDDYYNESQPQNGWIQDTLSFKAVGGALMAHYSKVRVVSTTTLEQAATERVIKFKLEVGKTYRIKVIRKILNPMTFSGSNIGWSDSYYNEIYHSIPTSYHYEKWSTEFVLTEQRKVIDEQRISVLAEELPIVSTIVNCYAKDDTKNIFITSAPPANAYDLFNKSVLACGNYSKISGVPIDETPKAYYLWGENPNEFSYDIDSGVDNVQQLKNTTIIENFYNQKNLWEMLMEIGKYIHARPIVRFGKNSTFGVDWRRYGDVNAKSDIANTASVYNSRFIAEYISSLSSYVDNMVQLGGYITEKISPKTLADSMLVSNNTAVIKTSKNIIEVLDMYAVDSTGARKSMIGNDNAVYTDISGETQNADTNGNGFIFEYNIYKTLSNLWTVRPNKGLAIYYNLGENVIQGLNYRLPQVNTGDIHNDYAIKQILGALFGINEGSWKDIKINDYYFEIKYRTKDTLRIEHTRPDLRKYLVATPYDNVPQHNQFNNQEDILVDSAKFGLNTFGKLIRTGNTVYKKLEWVNNYTNTKHAGELYKIYDNLYYVSRVHNIYYTDHIESEVEFSKDFNRLAQIIGIPSEPRFYEISEQSSINREFCANSYVLLSDADKNTSENKIESFVENGGGKDYIKDLLFSSNVAFPKYAITAFKTDGNNTDGYRHIKTVMNPVNTCSSDHTLNMEWDMEDNFSAGDQVLDFTTTVTQTADSAYTALNPVQYPDKYGRADLVDFVLVDDVELTKQQVNELPEVSLESIKGAYNAYFKSNNNIESFQNGLILKKDNREAISMNANVQMLTDSDRFVLSTYMWRPEKGNVYVGFGNKEVNKLSNGTIPANDFLVEKVGSDGAFIKYPIQVSLAPNYLEFGIDTGSITISTGEVKALQPNIVFNNESDFEFDATNGEFILKEAGVYTLKNIHLRIDKDFGHAASNMQLIITAYDDTGSIVKTYNETLILGYRIIINNLSITTPRAGMKLKFEVKNTASLIGFSGEIYSYLGNIQLIKGTTALRPININISNIITENNIDMTNIKSIVIYSDEVINDNKYSGSYYFIMAKNIDGLSNSNKSKDWKIDTPSKSSFSMQ